ncbi:glycoside hydrolase family 43 protein [Aulographum hederae CBS 113979]|uniref:Glycoside hydrolase family 43 protein n=1 Tax=Aulographum hederae CBS 113979 TaxID=1176131 RepID=A0A6G1GTW9_9PEZI|nr:glycoside hydrolase family 43 protein [Aulographum hederae CBS 113979]
MKTFFRVLVALLPLVSTTRALNSTYTNPVLPGWHSDPSCTFVPELDNTFFCVTSTFLAFPGIPVYASKDLLNWRLASSIITRSEQIPLLNTDYSRQSDGVFAATIRYHDGILYVITALVNGGDFTAVKIPFFTTTDPFKSEAWSDVKYIENPSGDIDPDTFWDDDGKVYMATAGVHVVSIDLETGAATEAVRVWNGTGGPFPEGPHVYKRDGYYYLLIGEGGTELNHSVTIARSRDIYGPYESYAANPILTNRGTDQYMQTVGHCDLFQDANGNWWGMALATRSGPDWTIYPMGRESVLFPATWNKGEWPILQPVRGKMEGWQLPPPTRDVRGVGPFVDESNSYEFEPGSTIPEQLVYWRTPVPSSYIVSPPGHPGTLQLSPLKSNLTGPASFRPSDDITFISARQTSTRFNFSIDISFSPTKAGEEAGISIFLTQFQHIDLSIGVFGDAPTPHPPVTANIPKSWMNGTITLQVSTANNVTYEFSAASSRDVGSAKILGTASARIVSGGTGPFTGTLVGAYATTNGGNGTTKAYISRWKYTPVAQQIDFDEYVPARNYSG